MFFYIYSAIACLQSILSFTVYRNMLNAPTKKLWIFLSVIATANLLTSTAYAILFLETVPHHLKMPFFMFCWGVTMLSLQSFIFLLEYITKIPNKLPKIFLPLNVMLSLYFFYIAFTNNYPAHKDTFFLIVGLYLPSSVMFWTIYGIKRIALNSYTSSLKRKITHMLLYGALPAASLEFLILLIKHIHVNSFLLIVIYALISIELLFWAYTIFLLQSIIKEIS
ncbi:MAG: hypothetical protein AB7R69_04760 [Candidatus Babeliales bacterium]